MHFFRSTEWFHLGALNGRGVHRGRLSVPLAFDVLGGFTSVVPISPGAFVVVFGPLPAP